MGTLTITGGTLRSRRVPTPSGRAVRPTPSKVKEALFSILGSRLRDARVLDLFAGSGALGFESLSRGAAHVTFVERHRPTAEALRGAARALGVDDRVAVVAAPAERAARVLDARYDVVFADPPYVQPYPQAAFTALRERDLIDPHTTVVYEHSSRTGAPDDPQMQLERSERYGEVALAFLRPRAAETA
ncbi:methyltransferase small [Vulcanimicrobium alpinum]|uniref:Methyltransferase small n=1 Tax=Vulcanimicrobium alpinum TaxID=3016050 RepID=A0AAN2C967_UNVUL|nr:16S rRNA (guanine(966)-N(2))-methyltransferase RsmD [Vulcanimicrobium alpinum]BDE06225.1 methyltransferase small [Vulcanimicrobium alpinum]